MQNILLLGSQSPSRQMLLEQSKIPFSVIQQDADETRCDWQLAHEEIVRQIALYKMGHVVMPRGKQEGELVFVLTADTLSCDAQGKIHGKPVDRADAIAKIKAGRDGVSHLATAFVIDKKIWRDAAWITEKQEVQVVSSTYTFNVPDRWIERYLENSVGYRASGAIAVEEYGAQFLQVVQGSYSAIVGLPLFEVRCALDAFGFWD
jgi:septum formation protein